MLHKIKKQVRIKLLRKLFIMNIVKIQMKKKFTIKLNLEQIQIRILPKMLNNKAQFLIIR